MAEVLEFGKVSGEHPYCIDYYPYGMADGGDVFIAVWGVDTTRPNLGLMVRNVLAANENMARQRAGYADPEVAARAAGDPGDCSTTAGQLRFAADWLIDNSQPDQVPAGVIPANY